MFEQFSHCERCSSGMNTRGQTHPYVSTILQLAYDEVRTTMCRIRSVRPKFLIVSNKFPHLLISCLF